MSRMENLLIKQGGKLEQIGLNKQVGCGKNLKMINEQTRLFGT